MTGIDPAALIDYAEDALAHDEACVILRDPAHECDCIVGEILRALDAHAAQGSGGDDTGEGGWTQREHAVAQQLYYEKHATWGYDPGTAASIPWLERARRALAAADRFPSSGSATTDPVPFAVTDRGFRRYEPIPTGYGHVVSVYESSAATEPCVWLEIDAKGATVGPDGDLAAHMRDEDAETLIRTLRQALDGHYQRRTELAASTQEGRRDDAR